MKKYIGIAMLSVSLFGLSSCLKDQNLVLDPAKSPAVVEFSTIYDLPAGSGAGYTLYSRAFDIKAEGVTSTFEVGQTGSSPASSDITANIAVNAAALTAYNTANGTHYDLLPATMYTIDPTVTIKSGERKGILNATFKTASFDLTKTYVLPLSISSVSSGTVSGNYGTVLYVIGAKNDYDGIYSIKGYVIRQNDPVLSGNIKAGVTRTLTTLTKYSNGFAQVWSDGSGIAGIDGTTITVDPATNKVTMSASTNPALKNLPTYDNRYDPATKTFYLSFYWGSGPTNRAATDTLTYIGPR